MPAQNLTQLLDFEGQFETAAQAVRAANGITAYISEQTAQLPLLSTGISFDIAPALDQLTFLPKPSNWPANTPPPQDFFRYTATLEFRIEVPRDRNTATVPGVATLFAEFRGKIRSAFMRTMAPFNSTNLPYYEISDIRPAGALTGTEGVRNIDFCSLRFAITFAIKPTAWPAWIVS